MPKEDVPLHTFTAEASAALDGPEWLRRRRAAGYEALTTCELPTESEEVWRYTPINSLVLDDFEPPADEGPVPAGDQLLAAVTTALSSGAGSVVVHNGRPRVFTGSSDEFGFGRADDVSGSAEALGSVQQGGDAL